jgi:hypothetical protein
MTNYNLHLHHSSTLCMFQYYSLLHISLLTPFDSAWSYVWYTTWIVQGLRSALSKRPNRLGAFLLSPGDDKKSSFRNVAFSSCLEFRITDEVRFSGHTTIKERLTFVVPSVFKRSWRFSLLRNWAVLPTMFSPPPPIFTSAAVFSLGEHATDGKLTLLLII